MTAPDPPPVWRGQWRKRLAYAAVVLVACVLGLGAAGDAFGGLSSPQGLVTALTVVPLLLTVRYPLMGWRVAWLGLAVGPLVNSQWWDGWAWIAGQLPVLLLLFWLAGIRHRRQVIFWMWGLSLLPLWLWVGHSHQTGTLLAAIAVTADAIAVDAVRSRRHAQRDLAAQTEQTELEQARRAVLQERARIARELHDVVAHHMSLIAVRAETAPYRLSQIDEPVRAEFDALSGAAREALTDMRRLLGVLRYDQPAGRAPQPQLADLPALVDSARHAGLAVGLSLPGGLDLVPPGVGVCAYRIVQESLSNASRHASGAAVSVSVGRADGAVTLRVSNGPGAGQADDGHGARTGQGLAGMRERVALLGGQLVAGPAPDGGFVVAATLPLGAAQLQPQPGALAGSLVRPGQPA
jgi:signal transduction histidine kinase